VTGIDIDPSAVEQAKENVALSPYSERIDIVLGNVCQLVAAQPFDAIVSNPPFFDQSLACPDDQRTQARHTSSLSYRDLMSAAWRLLSDSGVLYLVIPADYRQRLESEASLRGFFKVRQCGVRTTPRKPVRRYLLAFAKHPAPMIEQDEEILELQPKIRSPWYQELTSEFYLQEGVGHKDGQQHDDSKDESST
jgi:tRNA1Val (adenine37-N6)-methyltransferase